MCLCYLIFFIGQQILTPTLYMSTKLPFVNHLSIKILKFMYEPITNKIAYSEKLASNKWCFARSAIPSMNIMFYNNSIT